MFPEGTCSFATAMSHITAALCPHLLISARDAREIIDREVRALAIEAHRPDSHHGDHMNALSRVNLALVGGIAIHSRRFILEHAQADSLNICAPDDNWPPLLAGIRNRILYLPGGEDAVRDWEQDLRSVAARARLPALRADVARLSQQLETFRAMLRVALEVPRNTARAVEYFERWIHRTLEALDAATALRDDAELALLEMEPDNPTPVEVPANRELTPWTRALMDMTDDW